MSQLRHNCFEEDRLGKVCIAMVMLLCLCVMAQMLGVPMTLLNPAGAADTLAAAVLEGFSVPPTVPQLTLSAQTGPVTDAQPFVHVPVLASALFHPPVL
jgi:hypothetical protein